MYLSEFYLTLLVTIALVGTVLAPIILLLLYKRDLKDKSLW
ncbi:hypothetical protein HMF8227_02305 [Saliniradius amylolyticus]|uniref:Uncharacterized protein n=1 Tax=Saliniradius amylolyticus TaxID=2183582 RepID=A0A2S2E527_9ALTE|nr:hypothetical protein HMF8227_02305 [Saliniradius amylolyticus]